MTGGLTTEWTASTDAGDAPAMPGVVDRDTWQAEIDALRVREKRDTREGDAIAAARRRLPMVEVDPTVTLVGADGPLTLLEAFEGRQQLIAYYFMWRPGRPAPAQCEGCTWVTSQIGELSNGRPIAQWSRLEAGRSDDLTGVGS